MCIRDSDGRIELVQHDFHQCSVARAQRREILPRDHGQEGKYRRAVGEHARVLKLRREHFGRRRPVDDGQPVADAAANQIDARNVPRTVLQRDDVGACLRESDHGYGIEHRVIPAVRDNGQRCRLANHANVPEQTFLFAADEIGRQ